MTIKELMIFSNGNIAVFDEAGQQVSELQKPWMEMIFEFLVSRGVYPPDIKKIRIFNGPGATRIDTITPIEIPGGWNWSVK
jgi:hypothetical protein